MGCSCWMVIFWCVCKQKLLHHSSFTGYTDGLWRVKSTCVSLISIRTTASLKMKFIKDHKLAMRGRNTCNLLAICAGFEKNPDEMKHQRSAFLRGRVNCFTCLRGGVGQDFGSSTFPQNKAILMLSGKCNDQCERKSSRLPKCQFGILCSRGCSTSWYITSSTTPDRWQRLPLPGHCAIPLPIRMCCCNLKNCAAVKSTESHYTNDIVDASVHERFNHTPPLQLIVTWRNRRPHLKIVLTMIATCAMEISFLPNSLSFSGCFGGQLRVM